MGIVIFDISTSLDGYITAAHQTAEVPMGPGGDAVHDWAFGSDEANATYLQTAGASTGAVICGRTTYDTSLPWWEANGPTGEQRKPVIVLTHRAPADAPSGGVYTFVTGGLQAALDAAREAAGDADVTIMGGADIGRQFLTAGVVDELSLHVAPLLFGGGTRLFGDLTDHVKLTLVDCLPTPTAIHLRYRT
ncbi:MAG: dihydrofolate reductase family protein [Actinobacteria bacterium]|nr:dihydrofolate reductase family protein [Actinomycetota bacterium]